MPVMKIKKFSATQPITLFLSRRPFPQDGMSAGIVSTPQTDDDVTDEDLTES